MRRTTRERQEEKDMKKNRRERQEDGDKNRKRRESGKGIYRGLSKN